MQIVAIGATKQQAAARFLTALDGRNLNTTVASTCTLPAEQCFNFEPITGAPAVLANKQIQCNVGQEDNQTTTTVHQVECGACEVAWVQAGDSAEEPTVCPNCGKGIVEGQLETKSFTSFQALSQYLSSPPLEFVPKTQAADTHLEQGKEMRVTKPTFTDAATAFGRKIMASDFGKKINAALASSDAPVKATEVYVGTCECTHVTFASSLNAVECGNCHKEMSEDELQQTNLEFEDDGEEDVSIELDCDDMDEDEEDGELDDDELDAELSGDDEEIEEDEEDEDFEVAGDAEFEDEEDEDEGDEDLDAALSAAEDEFDDSELEIDDEEMEVEESGEDCDDSDIDDMEDEDVEISSMKTKKRKGWKAKAGEDEEFDDSIENIDLTDNIQVEEGDEVVANFAVSSQGQNPHWQLSVGGVTVATLKLPDLTGNLKAVAGDKFNNKAFATALDTVIRESGSNCIKVLASMGFKPVMTQVVTARIAKAADVKSARKIAEANADAAEVHTKQLIKMMTVAHAGINRGFFANVVDPMRTSLMKTLSSVGIKNPAKLINTALAASAEKHFEIVAAKAKELLATNPVAQQEIVRSILASANLTLSEDEHVDENGGTQDDSQEDLGGYSELLEESSDERQQTHASTGPKPFKTVADFRRLFN